MLGCLVEKALTTPQQYPLTLNSLALACNQSSNRDPVVSYDESAVEAAVTQAKSRGLARFVHPSHGRSVLRYRHELAEQLGLDQPQMALLGVLMLRGPQTPGELRSRTERMAAFADLHEVEAELAALADRQEPLVLRLGRSPGQKEDRFAHAFEAPSSDQVSLLSTVGAPSPPSTAAAPFPSSTAAAPSEVARLFAEVARLEAELASLRRQVEALRPGDDR